MRAIHGVSGGVVGAAFTRMHKAGVIRAVGEDTSSLTNTHGKTVALWIGAAA